MTYTANTTDEAKGTILVVDDEEIMRETVSMQLQISGYEVLKAADGVEGVELYEQHKDQIALTLLDHNMPGLSGAQVLEQIIALKPDAKVILSTGFASDELCREFQELGAVDIISKPFRRDELLSRIAQYIN